MDTDYDGLGDACDSSDDPSIMYGITKGDESTASVLYSHDVVSGVSTEIGDTRHVLIALQVNPADGLLYGVVRGASWDDGMDVGGWDSFLVTLDTATGAATQVVEMDVGPIRSLGFLQDGSAYGWTEDGDYFLSIDTATGAPVQIGDSHGSATHHMGVTQDDRVIWGNYDGDMYEIDHTNGERTSLGQLTTWEDGTTWESEGRNSVRGDITGRGGYWIGPDVTRDEEPANITTVKMGLDLGPVVVDSVPATVNFHAMTWAY